MKVVHISTSDIDGGAAIAAYRLHLALLERGIDSKMLVMDEKGDGLNIDIAKKGRIEKYVFSNIRKLKEKKVLDKYKNRRNPILFSTGKYGVDISDHPYVKEADVLHLHWINRGYISLESLKKLGKLNKKIIWTLHDMWVFTGGCHYSNGCNRYQEQCGNCPILETNKEYDITRKTFKRKEKIFKKLSMTIITCSTWLWKCAKGSSLLRDKEIFVLPNVLDEKVFKKKKNGFAREVLNLDKNKKYICFGAVNSTTNPRKGWKYLKEAISLLSIQNPRMKNEVELLVFGASHSEDIEELPFKTRFVGKVSDEYTLALIYNAADAFVAPSLEENLPNTVLESLHCGTPVVAFNIGGMPDMIEHYKNGYLAKYRDVESLAKGIEWSLKNLDKVGFTKDEFKKDNILNELLEIYSR